MHTKLRIDFNQLLVSGRDIKNNAIDWFIITFRIDSPKLILLNGWIIHRHSDEPHEATLTKVAPNNISCDLVLER